MPATKSFFATYHLTSAAHNARIAGEAEKALEKEGLDSVFRNESLRRWQPIHDAHVMTSFIETFAGVEAAVNELIDDPTTFSPEATEVVPAYKASPAYEINQLVEAYPGDFTRERTLQKYQLILLFTGNSPFDRGSEPYQSLYIIRKLRNYFVHHEPERVEPSEGNPDSSLGRDLQSKDFEINPFRDHEPFFPGQCLGYGCAAWVFEAAIEFMDEFFDRIDGRAPYESQKEGLFDELKPGWTEREPNW